MDKEGNCIPLPGIERGEIAGQKDGGYTVKSYDRAGLITPAMKPLRAEDGEYETGEKVYFFMHEDGTGRILGRME